MHSHNMNLFNLNLQSYMMTWTYFDSFVLAGIVPQISRLYFDLDDVFLILSCYLCRHNLWHYSHQHL